jgi:hypothetical protein
MRTSRRCIRLCRWSRRGCRAEALSSCGRTSCRRRIRLRVQGCQTLRRVQGCPGRHRPREQRSMGCRRRCGRSCFGRRRSAAGRTTWCGRRSRRSPCSVRRKSRWCPMHQPSFPRSSRVLQRSCQWHRILWRRRLRLRGALRQALPAVPFDPLHHPSPGELWQPLPGGCLRALPRSVAIRFVATGGPGGTATPRKCQPRWLCQRTHRSSGARGWSHASTGCTYR